MHSLTLAAQGTAWKMVIQDKKMADLVLKGWC